MGKLIDRIIDMGEIIEISQSLVKKGIQDDREKNRSESGKNPDFCIGFWC